MNFFLFVAGGERERERERENCKFQTVLLEVAIYYKYYDSNLIV